METQRIFIVLGLVLVSFLFWQDYELSKRVVQTPKQQAKTPEKPSDIPTIRASTDNADIPKINDQTVNIPARDSGKNISVGTDLFELSINPQGGTIDALILNRYPQSLQEEAPKIQLFTPHSGQTFLAQSGLISKANLPTHHSLYQAQNTRYELDADELVVPLYWRSDNGIEVVKTYRFRRNSYLIDLSYEIINRSQEAIYYASYLQLLRETLDEGNVFLPTFSGGAVYNNQDVYKKIEFSDFASQQPMSTKGGWLAVVQHYFVSAWVPNQSQNQRYTTKVLNDGKNLISAVGINQKVGVGESVNFQAGQLYAGPKLQNALARVKGLDKTVDYGILYIIAKPLELVLHWLYGFVTSWGSAIILLTILIKLLFYKLSETSYRSMAKMRTLSPKMQHLKELYGDDRQKLSQKMMDLYKQEKINPASGCLPIFIQIPVFIALYWVLLESVELRQVPFWWLSDLSSKDPYFILPILMGASMFFQQKLNPTPPDPMQAKIMMALPFVFTIFFLWMPSGLVLYWTVNNILSITQQWVINRRIEAQTK